MIALPCGMSDMNGIAQIKCGDQLGKIIGISIHAIASIGLTGSTMPAPVMGDNAESLVQEKHHLSVPVI